MPLGYLHISNRRNSSNMKQKYDPVWKRWETVPSAVEDCANVTSRYEQQLELQLNKTKEATPEQFEEWQETELKWWADRQFTIIWIACFVQLSALGVMAMIMMINDNYFG